MNKKEKVQLNIQFEHFPEFNETFLFSMYYNFIINKLFTNNLYLQNICTRTISSLTYFINIQIE